MSFHAVKFQTKILQRVILKDPRIGEIRRWGKICHKNNLTPLIENNISCGNISFRVQSGENKFIITASQMGYNKELPDDGFIQILDCNFEQGIVFALGEREPSSESFLHFLIYKTRPEINAIIHGHSAEILKHSGRLGLVETKTEEPYGSMELANSVAEVLAQNNFVVMLNHGFVSLGKNLDVAGQQALEILKSAS